MAHHKAPPRKNPKLILTNYGVLGFIRT